MTLLKHLKGPRRHLVQVLVTEEEFARIKRDAHASLKTISSYVRDIVLKAEESDE